VRPIDETVSAAIEGSIAKAVHGRMRTPEDWLGGAGLLAASVALPPAFFEVAAMIRAHTS
jgi:hypothetical protein